MKLFIGIAEPAHARRVEPAFISVRRLRRRVGDFKGGEWIMDSGAFSTITRHGGYPHPVSEYAAQIHRWKRCGRLLAVVSQDFMCEPEKLARTGLTVADHQRLTIERYVELRALVPDVYVMPVLQGYEPAEYAEHVRQYGDRLAPDAWVGVGSVCQRNRDPRAIAEVLAAILAERPDLRLHGFGVKATALRSPLVRAWLYSADSMAWCFAARRQGRNQNDFREGLRWRRQLVENGAATA